MQHRQVHSKKKTEKKIIYMHCTHPGTLNLSDSVVKLMLLEDQVQNKKKCFRSTCKTGDT